MIRQVVLRPEAEEDIQRAYDYLEQVRPGSGRKFSAKLRESFQRIETNSEAFGVVWEGVRAVRVKKFHHVVYYVISGDMVEVLAVLHGSRDDFAWKSRV